MLLPLPRTATALPWPLRRRARVRTLEAPLRAGDDPRVCAPYKGQVTLPEEGVVRLSGLVRFGGRELVPSGLCKHADLGLLLRPCFPDLKHGPLDLPYGRGEGRRLTARGYDSCIPARRAPSRRWANSVDVEPGRSDQPGDERVGVPPVAGAELVATPCGQRNQRSQVEKAPGIPCARGESSRAVDGLGDGRYGASRSRVPSGRGRTSDGARSGTRRPRRLGR